MKARKVRVLLAVVILVFSTFSFGVGTGLDQEVVEGDSERLEEILDDSLKEKMASNEDDEIVEVVIRLEPHEFGDSDSADKPLNEIDTERVISELKTHTERTQSPIIEHLEKRRGRVINTFWIANAILAEVEADSLDEIASFSEVWNIHENFEVETFDRRDDILDQEDMLEGRFDGPPDPYEEEWPKVEHYEHRRPFSRTGPIEDINPESSDELTWGLDRINVTDAWDEGRDGSDIRVAVSDTGVDIDHPDLEGKMVNVEDDEYHTGGWIEFDDEGNIVENSTPHDTSDHGTHCSGTVLGGNASGTNIGVAPEADLMHALVLPLGRGTFAQTLAGMEWKVEPHDRTGGTLEPVEEHRPHIASMSWGAPGYHEEREEPIKNMIDAGIIPVSAIGNDGEGTIISPAAIYEAFAVGASNETDEIADFSSGDIVFDGREDTPEEYVKPDFSAPGEEVKSAMPGDEWGYMSGTSMATPHIAGMIALIYAPYLTVEDIYQVLEESSQYYEAGDTLNETKNTRYGHGIVDAGKAVEHAPHSIGALEHFDLTNETAELKGELYETLGEEVEVYFEYREKGNLEWDETERETLEEPGVFESGLEDLDSGVSYEWRVVGEWEDEKKTTMRRTFTTHREVEVITLSPKDVTEENATLRGKVEAIYKEEADLFFRFREVGEDWIEIDMGETEEPTSFSEELEDLDFDYFEYQAVAESEGEEYVGDIVSFSTNPPEPEWCEDEGAYLISGAPELQWIRNDLSSDYVLNQDIDASETEGWFGGKGFEPIERFEGDFDGRGRSIENLYINRIRTTHNAIFSTTEEDAEIRDIHLENIEIRGGPPAGGLIGYNFGNVSEVTIEDSFIAGESVGGLIGINLGLVENLSSLNIEAVGTGEFGGSDIGGLVGSNYYCWWTGRAGIVRNSSADGYVDGEYNIGGLAGLNRGVIENSYTEGTVKGNHMVGGLVGSNHYAGGPYAELLENTSSSVEVIGNITVGGLAGENGQGSVNNSYATGNVSGGDNVGGLVGTGHGDSMVFNSYAKGAVNGVNNVGGLVGTNGAVISHSYATGNVTGEDRIGGLVGNHRDGPVIHSYAISDVTGEEDVGGLAGHNREGSIMNTSAFGSVYGEKYVGGLVGRVGERISGDLGHEGTVDRSYAVGEVSTHDGLRVGGLVGHFEYGQVVDSYWDINASGMDDSARGTGKTTAEMVEETTFRSAFPGMGWDFDEDWDIIEGETYPFLRWQEDDPYLYPEQYELKVEEPKGEVFIDDEWVKDYPHSESYVIESEIDLSVEPAEGYDFQYWKVNDEIYEDEDITLYLREDITVEPVFELITSDLGFEVYSDDGERLKGAEITVDDIGAETTDEDGSTVFEKLEPGEYHYTVEKEGYEKVEGKVEIVEEDVEEDVILELKTYDLDLTILCEEDEPVVGATVELNGLEKNTNEEGEALFKDIEPGEYNYTVEKDEFVTLEREVEIVEEDVEEEVILELKTYDLDFTILDKEDEPVVGATVELNGLEKNTNEEGEALFKDIEPGEYNYTVEKDGYGTVEDSLTVEDADIEEVLDIEEEEEGHMPTWVIPVLVLLVAALVFTIWMALPKGKGVEEEAEEGIEGEETEEDNSGKQ